MKVYAEVLEQPNGAYLLNTLSLTCPIGKLVYKVDIPYGMEPTSIKARAIAACEIAKILSSRVIADGMTAYPTLKGSSL